MEIGRKYGSQAATSVRGAARSVSSRVSKGAAEARTSGSRTSAVSQRASNATRRVGESLDRGFNYTQRRLEESDTAVIAFSLILIVACIVLTTLAVYLWNRF